MTRITRRTALAGALGLGLTACSATKPQTPTPSTPVPTTSSPTPTPSATPSVDTRPRWPLTGELVKKASDVRHAAVAVKVPDNKWEHPQRGIDSADIVFVELEGYLDANGYSSTRLVPVFHSSMPASVEPVRSVRPVDVPLLSPMDAIVGNTGGSKWVIAYAEHYRAHLEVGLSYLATVGTGSYGTDQSRVYQLNGQTYYDRATVCHPRVLAEQTKRFRSGPPQAYFPFATGTDVVSTTHGKPGTGLQVPYKGNGYAMGYHYDTKSKRYLRSMPWGPHVLADGTRVSTDNIMVIKVHQHFGKIFHGGGHAEPLEDVIDTHGSFLYFNRGRYVTGSWKKGAIAQPFSFTVSDGSPLRMASGQTYVELPDTKAELKIDG